MVATEKIRKTFFGCHGLGPWRFTFAANLHSPAADSKERETPPRKAVASKSSLFHISSSQREPPPGKPGAS